MDYEKSITEFIVSALGASDDYQKFANFLSNIPLPNSNSTKSLSPLLADLLSKNAFKSATQLVEVSN